jgi:hypothetical protein
MVMSFATITAGAEGILVPGTDMGARIEVSFTPLTVNKTVTKAADGYTNIGAIKAVVGIDGQFKANPQIPLGLDQGDVVWVVSARAIDKIPGLPKTWTYGEYPIPESATLAALIDVDVIALTPEILANVSAAAVTATTKAAEAEGFAEAALDSAANADSSADLAAAAREEAEEFALGFTAGDATALAPGATPTLDITGPAGARVLDLGIPAGVADDASMEAVRANPATAFAQGLSATYAPQFDGPLPVEAAATYEDAPIRATDAMVRLPFAADRDTHMFQSFPNIGPTPDTFLVSWNSAQSDGGAASAWLTATPRGTGREGIDWETPWQYDGGDGDWLVGGIALLADNRVCALMMGMGVTNARKVGLSFSTDDGHTWTDPDDMLVTHGWVTGTVMPNSFVETESGAWLVAVYGTAAPFVVRVMRSTNQGTSWTEVEEFTYATSISEATIVSLGGSDLRIVIRVDNDLLQESPVTATSADDGATWSALTVAGYQSGAGNPRVIALRSGVLVGGIRSTVDGYADTVTSRDGGTTWSQPIPLMRVANRDTYVSLIETDRDGEVLGVVGIARSEAVGEIWAFKMLDGSGVTNLGPVASPYAPSPLEVVSDLAVTGKTLTSTGATTNTWTRICTLNGSDATQGASATLLVANQGEIGEPGKNTLLIQVGTRGANIATGVAYQFRDNKSSTGSTHQWGNVRLVQRSTYVFELWVNRRSYDRPTFIPLADKEGSQGQVTWHFDQGDGTNGGGASTPTSETALSTDLAVLSIPTVSEVGMLDLWHHGTGGQTWGYRLYKNTATDSKVLFAEYVVASQSDGDGVEKGNAQIRVVSNGAMVKVAEFTWNKAANFGTAPPSPVDTDGYVNATALHANFATLVARAATGVPNNSFFVDSADSLLKFRNSAGVLKTVNLT